jgi:hypothetical protein
MNFNQKSRDTTTSLNASTPLLPMENLRRSARSTKKQNYYNEFSPSYPDNEPANEFESRVSTLNQESFPWKTFSNVDDILVYGLFASKRRVSGYRSIIPDRASGKEEPPITRKEGIQIRKICGDRLEEQDVRQVEDVRRTAEALVKGLPTVFSPDQLPVIQQYGGFQVLCLFWFSDTFVLFSLLHRYNILYSADSPVALQKVSFDGVKISLGLKALRAIPAGCPILSSSASMSGDLVPPGLDSISIIASSSGQKGPIGLRLMLGPLRFANHDCEPNCQVRLGYILICRSSCL